MARVNHKKVKQLIFEKRSKITDRQFFTSRILAIHFEDIAMGTDAAVSIQPPHPCQFILEAQSPDDGADG